MGTSTTSSKPMLTETTWVRLRRRASLGAATLMMTGCTQLVGLGDLPPLDDDNVSTGVDASASQPSSDGGPSSNGRPSSDAAAPPVDRVDSASNASLDAADAQSDRDKTLLDAAQVELGRDVATGADVTRTTVDASTSAIDASTSTRDASTSALDAGVVTDPCANVTCKQTPPAATCYNSNTRRTRPEMGTCSGGSCNYPFIDTPCSSNTLCTNGNCALCSSDTSCGPDCASCSATKPKCKTIGSASTKCVACLKDQNCPPDSICDTTIDQCTCGPVSAKCVGNTVHSCGANGQWADTACTWPTPACSNGTCVAPPSCSGLASTCGPQGNESCCTSPLVTGGTFFRDYDGITANHLSKANPATVRDFRLDKYPVTVGRFRKFVASGVGTQAKPLQSGDGARANLADSGWDSNWNTSLVPAGGHPAALKCSMYNVSVWTDSAGANETKPLNCVDWYQAFSFCAWDGGLLPTSAELNYAAVGGSEQREYAWPNVNGAGVIDCNHDDTYECHSSGGLPFNVGSTLPTGAGKWGHANLNGGVGVWALDYGQSVITPCDNCADLRSFFSRVLRGGAFNVATDWAMSSFRGTELPETHRDDVGIRCARTP